MNKPVAWTTDGKEVMRLDNDDDTLHIHSVELTDDEIESIANANVDGNSSMEQLKWFARAILRKAQENE